MLKQVGKVNYLVDMHDHRKRKRVIHVNLMRKWYEAESSGYWTEEVSDQGEEDLSWKDDEDSVTDQPQFGELLLPEQRQEMERLLHEFSEVFSNKPGHTQLAVHRVDTGTERPVKLSPYRILHAY